MERASRVSSPHLDDFERPRARRSDRRRSAKVFCLPREPVCQPPQFAAVGLRRADGAPPPSDSFLGLAVGLVFLTVMSLSGMLVSPANLGSDTNKSTNILGGYQQSAADDLEPKIL